MSVAKRFIATSELSFVKLQRPRIVGAVFVCCCRFAAFKISHIRIRAAV